MGIITDLLSGMPLNAVLREQLTALELQLQRLEKENADLKMRVAKYESSPGEKCPMCRKPTLALKSNAPNKIFGNTGLNDYVFGCSSCEFQETISADSAGKAWGVVRG